MFLLKYRPRRTSYLNAQNLRIFVIWIVKCKQYSQLSDRRKSFFWWIYGNPVLKLINK